MKKRNRLLRNKRGFESFILEYGLPFIFLIVAITLFIRITQKIESQHAFVGEKAFALLTSKTELSALELKYHELAKYGLYGSLHEFAFNGALPSLALKEKCNVIDDYSKWTKYDASEKEFILCYPENSLLSNLESLYSQRLTAFLAQTLPNLNAKHEFEIKSDLDGKTLAIKETSQQQAVIRFKDTGKLSRSISLDYSLPYDFSIYGRLIAFSKQLINKCQVYSDQKINACISAQVSDFNKRNSLSLKSINTDSPRTLKFDLEDNPLPIFENSKFGLKPIIYKFALDIPDPKLKIELLPDQDTIATGTQARFLLTLSNMPEKLTAFADDSMIAYLKKQQGEEFIKIEGSTIALGNLDLDKNLGGYILPFNTFERGSFILSILVLKDLDFARLKQTEEYASKAFDVIAVEQ
ncbi:TPA: hypothetical protein HA246_05250 [Candidatus Woesearchaeota archaeon]|nr:hypothetical protein [Candidatus Woesearchaeota archaeon]